MLTLVIIISTGKSKSSFEDRFKKNVSKFYSSFARIPDINRDQQMGDTRKIKILHTDEAVKLDAGNLKNVFSSSPDDCLGIEMTNPDDNLKFYEFR